MFGAVNVPFATRVTCYVNGSRAGQATDDNIIRHMRIACWLPKATYTHSECEIIVVFATATVVSRTRLSGFVVWVYIGVLFHHV
jgi:hypothetical protein